MTFYRNRTNNDTNSRVAAYESLLDLFTVISFILIFASFIYMARSAAFFKNSASVSAYNAVGGSGVLQELPKDLVLLIISPGGVKDSLTLKNGATGTEHHWQVTEGDVEEVLNGLSSTIEQANIINLSIHKQKQLKNPRIALIIEHWLPEHRHGSYQVTFSGGE